MKRFLVAVMEWKASACMMFTGSMILFLIIFFCTGRESMSLLQVVTVLILSALGTLLQLLAFTDCLFKKMRYSVRLLVFALPFLALLAGCAVLGQWFPVEYLSAWWIFGGIFLLCLAGISVSFEIYFQMTGKRYDGLLGQYKKHKEQGE